jgi:hypothetical protein
VGLQSREDSNLGQCDQRWLWVLNESRKDSHLESSDDRIGTSSGDTTPTRWKRELNGDKGTPLNPETVNFPTSLTTSGDSGVRQTLLLGVLRALA